MLREIAHLYRNIFWPCSAKAIHFLEDPDPDEVSSACKGYAEERIFCFWMGGGDDTSTNSRSECVD